MSHVCCCRYYSSIFIRISSIYICPIIVLLLYPEDMRDVKNIWQMFAIKHPKWMLQGVNSVMIRSDPDKRQRNPLKGLFAVFNFLRFL